MSERPPYSPFRERLITYLLPFFLPLTSDFELARAEVLETLESYGSRTRAEMLNAMRIIALSFTSLELMAAAKGTDMPPEMRLHYIRHANSLARTCQQNETALAKRLAADLPDAVEQSAEPIDDIPDTEVADMIQQAQAQIDAYRQSIPGPQVVPNPSPPKWDTAMMTAATAQGAPRSAAPA